MVSSSPNAVTENALAYYNGIAGGYDALLQQENSNALVRSRVAERFCALVKKGPVLDLGGGTGQDIPWLTASGYRIIFCEPAAGMRQIAIEKTARQNDILFLDDNNLDFRNWAATLPFSEKLTGVLMNFAVLNCIPDIDKLFRHLSLVAGPGSNILALVLNSGLKTLLHRSFTDTVNNLVFGSRITFKIAYRDKIQLVHLHTKKEIKKAASPYFTLTGWEQQPGSGFTLLQLAKQ